MKTIEVLSIDRFYFFKRHSVRHLHRNAELVSDESVSPPVAVAGQSQRFFAHVETVNLHRHLAHSS